MKLKNLIKIIGFLLLVAIIYCGIYKVVSWKDTSGTDVSVFKGLYETDDNLMDVVFLGSSHCYCTINNALLWDDYGLSTYNMSVSGQDMVSTYYCLEEVLKTQSPQVVCVEMCYTAWYGYAVEGNLLRNVLNYKYSKNFYNAVHSLMEEERQLDVLLKLPIVHTRYKELTENDFVQTTSYNRGYVGSYDVTPMYDTNYDPEGEVTPLREDTQEWIYKIIELCRSNNIELVFYLSPFAAEEYEMSYFRGLAELAKDENIPLVNFFELYDTIGINYEQDYRDRTHLNNYGAKKVTDYMGKYLIDHYELKNHQGYSEYYLWDENSKAWEHEEAAHTLVNTTELVAYFNCIDEMEDYTFVVSLSGDYALLDETVQVSVEKTGIDQYQYFTGGVYVLDNHQVVYESKAEPEYFYHRELSNGDLAVIGTLTENEEGETVSETEILLNNEELTKVENGINIVVYDNFTGELVDVVGFSADNGLTAYR